MKIALPALLLLSVAGTATARQYAANDYRTCPTAQTERGVSVVQSTCGTLTPPEVTPGSLQSLGDLEAARQRRDTFARQATAYATCINGFINAYRRPGTDATSTAPDEAACAHAWAEDQVTQTVIDYGRACVDFSDRSMTDPNIPPWSGACYPEPAETGDKG